MRSSESIKDSGSQGANESKRRQSKGSAIATDSAEDEGLRTTSESCYVRDRIDLPELSRADKRQSKSVCASVRTIEVGAV